MPAIPLPFVVSLFMAVLLLRLVMRGERNLRPAIWFIAACTVTSTITGLRWSLDLEIARILQLVAGSLLPIIAWFCFSALRRESGRPWLYLAAAAVARCAWMRLLCSAAERYAPPSSNMPLQNDQKISVTETENGPYTCWKFSQGSRRM